MRVTVQRDASCRTAPAWVRAGSAFALRTVRRVLAASCWRLWSNPSRQSTPPIECPGHPVWADHADDGTSLERFEANSPGCQGKGVLPADDGEHAARCGNGPFIDPNDLPPRLRGQIGGVETAR